ncbi:hypothetical protein [Ornithinimicrobium murale]|uniref:hypothetical protein n=1 Tax=Ornithinimicrobium murale TaxID=1050153 RepID=UPI000E0DD993|nr:hypothetical protein [Ornithinimicrobium murale]
MRNPTKFYGIESAGSVSLAVVDPSTDKKPRARLALTLHKESTRSFTEIAALITAVLVAGTVTFVTTTGASLGMDISLIAVAVALASFLLWPLALRLPKVETLTGGSFTSEDGTAYYSAGHLAREIKDLAGQGLITQDEHARIHQVMWEAASTLNTSRETDKTILRIAYDALEPARMRHRERDAELINRIQRIDGARKHRRASTS